MPHSGGLDVSQKTTAICVVDADSWRIWRGDCPTHLEKISTLVGQCSAQFDRHLKVVERYLHENEMSCNVVEISRVSISAGSITRAPHRCSIIHGSQQSRPQFEIFSVGVGKELMQVKYQISHVHIPCLRVRNSRPMGVSINAGMACSCGLSRLLSSRNQPPS